VPFFLSLNNKSTTKIVSRETLAKIVLELKQQGARIVTTNGSFDLLHIGHVTMLQEARSLGDVLIVGVNSDTSVRRYKGQSRPICPQEHRVKMLAALMCTDYITVFDELTPIPLLELIQPDIHVNSPEHGQDCVEREVVERYGGRIYLSQLVEGMSTSQLIQHIIDVATHEPCRAIFLNPVDLLHENQEEVVNTLKQLQTKGFRLFMHDHPDPMVMEQVQQITMPSTFERAGHLRNIEPLVDTYDISLVKSFIISSDMQDIQMGRQINCKTILLQTSLEPRTQNNQIWYLGPHYTAKTVQEAADLILHSW
jgi:rfaE bifunctional protein nucleotidyltransferase chain/domain